MTLEWKPAQDESFDHDELEYHIHLSEEEGFTPDSNNRQKSVTDAINVTVEELEPDTLYFARLVVENPSGRKVWSNQIRSRTGESELELKDDVRVRTDAATKEEATDSDIELADDELFFPDDAEVPEVGDFVASGDDDGYMVKVVAVESVAQGWVVTVDDAALNEIYQNLDLQTTVRLDRLDDATQQAAQGIRTASAATTGEFHWEETGLSIYDPQQHTTTVASGVATSNNGDSIENGRQIIEGDEVTVDAPVQINADPQDGNGFFTIKAESSGSMTICEHEWDFSGPTRSHDDSLVRVNQESPGEYRGSWVATTDDIDDRGRPYILEVEIKGKEDCSSGTGMFSNNPNETISVEIPLYVTKGTAGVQEKRSATVSVDEDIKITNELGFLFVPSFDIGASISWGSLDSATLAADADMEFLQRLTIEASQQATLENKRLTLLKKEDHRFVRLFNAGGVPIVVSGEFGIDLRFDGEVNGKVELTEEIELMFRDARFGLEYRNGSWEQVGDFEPEYNFSIGGEGEAGAEVKVTIIPDLTVSFYGSASGRLLVEPYGYAEAGLQGHFFYEHANGQSASELDYHFTELEAGGGVDVRLFAGLSIWDRTIASYPSGAQEDDPDSFLKAEIIGRTPFAGIPDLWVEDYVILPPDPATGEGRVRIQGKYEEVANPFYELLGLNPQAFITFGNWLPPSVSSAHDNYSFSHASNGADGAFILRYQQGGDYSVRLAAHSSLGWFVRQLTDSVELNVEDPQTQAVISAGEHTVSWGQEADAESYNVYIATESGCDVTQHETCQNGAAYTDQTPPFYVPEAYWGEDYYLIVEAKLTDGSSAYFPEYGVSNGGPDPDPDPDPVIQVDAGDEQVEIGYDAIAGAQAYNVYYSLESGFDPENYAVYDGGTLLQNPIPPHTESELENGTTHYFVLEVVVGGESFYSAEVAATPSKEDETTVAFPLNDTGIAWCLDSHDWTSCPVESHPGQDGVFGRDALALEGELEKEGDGDVGFDFTKLDSNGEPLPIQDQSWHEGGNEVDGTRWSCVKDNHTGLIWEVKTDDGGLRDKSNTYTWYQLEGPNMDDPGEQDGGSCMGSDCDTHSYVQAVNAQGLCGSNDWRLPTILELQSITHHGYITQAMDPDFFPHGHYGEWSALPDAGNSDKAWVVWGNPGLTRTVNKSDNLRVLLVRDRR